MAELNIVDNNIIKAYSNYKKAFNIKEIPFGLDQYNFAVCCAILNKKKESFKHVKFLIEYGLWFCRNHAGNPIKLLSGLYCSVSGGRF